MRRTWATWKGVVGLVWDATKTLAWAPVVHLLQFVDDAHDTDPEGDEP